MPTRRLLIVQCGARKSPAPGAVPALQRYAGPLWQTVRTHLRDARVMVLSAKHGLIDGARPIEPYDQKMDDRRMEELLACGVETAQGVRHTSHGPKRFGPSALHEALNARSEAGCEAFERVALVGGWRYVRVGEAMVAGLRVRGLVSPDAQLAVINDEIGKMRRRVRLWLEDA